MLVTSNFPLNQNLSELYEKFKVISGTSPSSSGGEIIIPYPSGYTRDNCIVVGFKLLMEGDYYITSAYSSRILLSQNIYGVAVYVEAESYLNRPMNVYLSKLI